MLEVNVKEARSKLSELLNKVEKGLKYYPMTEKLLSGLISRSRE